MDIDLEELAALVDLLKEADFSEFRYEKGDLRVVIRRGSLDATRARSEPPRRAAAPAPDAALPMPLGTPQVSALPADTVQVTAPLLWTFYPRPKPGEPPFVAIGDRVEADSVIGIVEVMKLMNSVTAGCAGVVVAIHAAEGELVEFGQPLVSIAPQQP